MNDRENFDANAAAGVSSKVEGHEFRNDIVAVRDNASVSTMLETVCMATGLRFAAVARVNEQRWVTCSAVDYLDFGLLPGDELVVESTLCHEVRQHTSEIIINDVSCDEVYRDHPTPKAYGVDFHPELSRTGA